MALALFAASAPASASPEPARHPTDLVSLIELRDDYTRGERTVTNALTVRGDYAPKRWVAFRVDVPFAWADTVKKPPTLGLGDISGRLTLRVAASDVSLLTGADYILDSASSKGLGGARNIIAPFATIAWELGPGAWVRLQLQQLASFGGDPGQTPVSASSVRPYAFVELPRGYWLVLDQTLRVDHRGPRRVAYTGILEGGKELTKSMSVYVDPGVEIDSPWAMTWLMTGGVRWVMP